MSKTELVNSIAEKANISKAEAARVLEATLESIVAGLQNDGKVSITGFGIFSKKERSAREGINPITKEKISIPAKMAVSFKAGSKLKDAVN